MRKLFYILPGLILLLSNNCFAKKVSTYKKSSICKTRSCSSGITSIEKDADNIAILPTQKNININITILQFEKLLSYSTHNYKTLVNARAPPYLFL